MNKAKFLQTINAIAVKLGIEDAPEAVVEAVVETKLAEEVEVEVEPEKEVEEPSELETLKAENEALKAELEALKSELEALKGEAKTATETVEELQVKLSAIENSPADSKINLSATPKPISKAQARLAALRESVK